MLLYCVQNLLSVEKKRKNKQTCLKLNLAGRQARTHTHIVSLCLCPCLSVSLWPSLSLSLSYTVFQKVKTENGNVRLIINIILILIGYNDTVSHRATAGIYVNVGNEEGTNYSPVNNNKLTK